MGSLKTSVLCGVALLTVFASGCSDSATSESDTETVESDASAPEGDVEVAEVTEPEPTTFDSTFAGLQTKLFLCWKLQ